MTEREKTWKETHDEIEDWIENQMLTKKFFCWAMAIFTTVVISVIIFAAMYAKLLIST